MSYELDVSPGVIEPGQAAVVTVGLPERPGDQSFDIQVRRRSDGEVAASGSITLHLPPWTVGTAEDEQTDYYLSLEGDALELEQTGAREFVVRAPE